MTAFNSRSETRASTRELRVALSVEVHDHVQRLARLQRCSPARIIERALREQVLAEGVERWLARAQVVDAQLEAIADALIATGRARR
ncbi:MULTISPECIES: hypothetical protein [Hyphomicrobiales]|jgi:predicted transcriptional regulator|uniref:hypothetical protein n=1 Tax=Methylobacterium sp. CCH7-A2 TaxID=1768789 RepID=UPI00082B93E2|nr:MULTISPECIES: hypothetical protein [Hyphomicrobiales]